MGESIKYIHEKLSFKYFLKVDDDSFVRVDKIINILEQDPSKNLYWGFFDGRANVKVNGPWAEHKWILCDTYLPHARGGGYILSYDLVHYLSTNSRYLQIFNSEDISIGAWLGPLIVDRRHDIRFNTEYKSRGCFNEYIITHKDDILQMRKKFDMLQKHGVLCEREFKLRQSYVYNWKTKPSQCCVRYNKTWLI